MCVMSEAGEGLARVGVRELRQNLSVYLRRVKSGESLEVTERGHTVARLVPSGAGPSSVYARLVAEGRIRPAKGNLAELGPPLPAGPGRPLSLLLQEMRDEERR